MDTFRHSFKTRAKDGSFTSASLEESYQPFISFVLQGLKFTANWPESLSPWNQHPFISTARNKTQTNNIAFLLVRELFKLHARLQKSFKCSLNKNEIVFFFQENTLFRHQIRKFFFYFFKKLGRSGDRAMGNETLLGWP